MSPPTWTGDPVPMSTGPHSCDSPHRAPAETPMTPLGMQRSGRQQPLFEGQELGGTQRAGMDRHDAAASFNEDGVRVAFEPVHSVHHVGGGVIADGKGDPARPDEGESVSQRVLTVHSDDGEMAEGAVTRPQLLDLRRNG